MKYAKICLAKICNECDVKTAGVLVLKNRYDVGKILDGGFKDFW